MVFIQIRNFVESTENSNHIKSLLWWNSTFPRVTLVTSLVVSFPLLLPHFLLFFIVFDPTLCAFSLILRTLYFLLIFSASAFSFLKHSPPYPHSFSMNWFWNDLFAYRAILNIENASNCYQSKQQKHDMSKPKKSLSIHVKRERERSTKPHKTHFKCRSFTWKAYKRTIFSF